MLSLRTASRLVTRTITTRRFSSSKMSSIQDLYFTVNSAGKVSGGGAESSTISAVESAFKASRCKGKAGEVVTLYGQGANQDQTVVLVGTGEFTTTPATTEAAQNKLKVSSPSFPILLPISSIYADEELISLWYDLRRNLEDQPPSPHSPSPPQPSTQLLSSSLLIIQLTPQPSDLTSLCTLILSRRRAKFCKLNSIGRISRFNVRRVRADWRMRKLPRRVGMNSTGLLESFTHRRRTLLENSWRRRLI